MAVRVIPDLLPVGQAARMAEVFGVLADPTRVRILYALSQEAHTTSELAAALGLSDSAVSHQLRSLRQLHLVASRRAGKQVWHRLADEHVRSLIVQGLDHAREEGRR
ncbi:MAG: metalloregulator ArsR/SmtB family transcription factor [Dehalococcoidia bacterium]